MLGSIGTPNTGIWPIVFSMIVRFGYYSRNFKKTLGENDTFLYSLASIP